MWLASEAIEDYLRASIGDRLDFLDEEKRSGYVNSSIDRHIVIPTADGWCFVFVGVKQWNLRLRRHEKRAKTRINIDACRRVDKNVSNYFADNFII